MNYLKHYQSLIEKAKSRKITGYYELHHIIPKCIGGSDSPENLVGLTPEEHYVAHQLLCRIYKNNPKLILAAMMMCTNRKGNKVYGWLRRAHSLAMSEMQAGEKNSQFGTRWIFSETEKRSRKIDKNLPLPLGWSEGRKAVFDKNHIKCKQCNLFFKQKRLEIYCSHECKILYKKSKSQKIIDQNLDKIIQDFQVTNSITKTLLKYGIDGRKGNTYLSKILKERGFPVLKRRNS
jgi:hypothetical protein